MYPRLRLAKNLLRDDGVIFISIDDNEVHNLRKICDEIFGEENFVAQIIWQRAFSPKNDAKYFSDNHDYIIVYAKQIGSFEIGHLPRTEEANNRYNNLDNDPRGKWISDNLTVKTYSAKYDYPITVPSGRIVRPSHGSCWRVSKERFEELKKDNRIWFGTDGNNVPRLKRFLCEVQNQMVSTTLWSYKEVGHNQEGRQEVKQLFDDRGYFDGPKPVRLLKRILQIANCCNSDIILDFFSGSATAAHAVMQFNAEDGGNRQFIMVQLPEPTDENSEAYKAGYKNICEIGKERIRRAGEKIKEENKDKKGIENLDIGFKVLELDSSNIKLWDNNPEDLELQLWDMVNPIKEDRSEQDIAYEIMLKYGIDLTMDIEEITIKGKKAYSVGLGYLIICLDDHITVDVVEEIGKLKPERAVFKDSGFLDDNVKINAIQILKKFDVEDFRST